ncbi:MAG: ISKra4 family transposase [Acidimicrobiales bacterium]
MRLRVQVVVEADQGEVEVVRDAFELAPRPLAPDTVGIGLAEAKELLAAVQGAVVDEQVKAALSEQERCAGCGRAHRHKDARTIVLRTLFGTLRLPSPRWYRCGCGSQPTKTFSPLAALLPERTTPELVYLEAKFAGLMSYGMSARLLAEVLPLGRALDPSAVRHHAQAVAQRLEDELGPERVMFIEGCQDEWDRLPSPDLPLVVGLDGGFVHSAHQRSRRDGWFEVIAGKSVPADGNARCFGFVQTYDPKPKRRLYELLRAQGMAPNQHVVFITDGADDVRDLPLYLNPRSEHLLDWFHVTMRITVLGQLAKGLRAPPPHGDGDEEEGEEDFVDVDVARELERLKWFLWHGNVFRALDAIEGLADDLFRWDPEPERAKLLKAVAEFDGYIRANASSIPSYAERYLAGELISSAFVEATVNQVISRRMVKKQAMRWTPQGAHLLLQVRTRVLNGQLAADFRRWYPSFAQVADGQEVAA